MRQVLVLIVCALACAGCGADRELLSQVPQAQGTARADYQKLASCVAGKLDGPGMTKTDLPPERTSKLSLNSGGVRFWEAIFKSSGPMSTDWSVTATNTLWGAYPRAADEVTTAIKACT